MGKDKLEQPNRDYWRPANMLYPLPVVMISCGNLKENDAGELLKSRKNVDQRAKESYAAKFNVKDQNNTPVYDTSACNIMTAAWAGTICSDPVMVSVSIRPERYSHHIIKESGEFVINLTTKPLTFATDYCGVASGKDVDKYKKMKLTPLPSKHIAAPGIAESPVCLECKVERMEHLGSHDMFIARVLSVSVDKSYMDEKGSFKLNKSELIAYSHGEYYSLGKLLGRFGYSVRKQKKR